MRLLKFVEKFKQSQVMNDGDTWVYHYRVYRLTDLPDRLFIELTQNYGDNLWRTWYCPTVPEFKGWRKQKAQRYGIGGNAGLGYWFDKYVRKG